MAELAPQERLLPSLLDRLTDDRPRQREESRDQRVGSDVQLRQSVLRDLEALLNTVNLDAVFDLDPYPGVRDTVINYGLPPLSGHSLGEGELEAVEREIRRCIEIYEPRILKQGLKVSVIDDTVDAGRGSLAFRIEGTLWGRPMPEALYLRTELDLESGRASVQEA